MAYGDSGRHWNLGLSDHSRLSATTKQLFYLQKLTGIDHRGRGLTIGQAGELIDKAAAERAQRKAGLSRVGEQLFNGIYQKALEAANKAGDEWISQNKTVKFSVFDAEEGRSIPVYDAIGTAWITWPRRGSDLYKWLKENLYDGQTKVFHIPHRHEERLEAGLQLACMQAAYSVFKRSGTSIGDIKLLYRAEDAADQAA